MTNPRFITTELVESKYKDIVDLKEELQKYILALYQLLHEDPIAAKQYAEKCLEHDYNSGLQFDATNLHNVAQLVLVEHGRVYAYDQLRSLITDVAYLNLNKIIAESRQTLMTFEKLLNVKTLKEERRIIGDYAKATEAEKSRLNLNITL